LSSEKKIKYKSTLQYLLLIMVMAITAISFTTLSLESHIRHYFVLLVLNITAVIASTLGVISIIQYGLYGVHGKSYLFLTLGIICWFLADIIITCYYVVMGEELEVVSIVDFFYFIGYLFLSLHLFFIIKHLKRKINYRIVIIISILTILFVIYNVISIIFSEFIIDENFISVLVSLLYPYSRFNINCSFCTSIGMLKKRLSTIFSLASFFFVSFYKCYS
jgi:hypothetical protein